MEWDGEVREVGVNLYTSGVSWLRNGLYSLGGEKHSGLV